MPSPDAFSVLLVLLPGFVTTGIIRALTISPENSEFDKVVNALSYSFLNYMLFAAIGSYSQSPTSFFNPSAPLSQPLNIVLLGGIALGMGFLVSAYKNNDCHKFLRKIRLTNRSSRPDIWHDSLVEGSAFHVIVTLEDGRRILGWPSRYSDDMGKPALFLTEAAWLVDGDEISTGNEGILLLAPMKIASVEFLRFEAETPEQSNEEEQQSNV